MDAMASSGRSRPGPMLQWCFMHYAPSELHRNLTARTCLIGLYDASLLSLVESWLDEIPPSYRPGGRKEKPRISVEVLGRRGKRSAERLVTVATAVKCSRRDFLLFQPPFSDNCADYCIACVCGRLARSRLSPELVGLEECCDGRRPRRVMILAAQCGTCMSQT